jgi:hypothetical protein
VLVDAIRDGLGLLTWAQDSFAFADDYDEVAKRYRGLRGGQAAGFAIDNLSGLLVNPEVALEQQKAEIAPQSKPDQIPPGKGPGPVPPTGPAPNASPPKRFHGSVTLDPRRVGRDAGRIGDEVVAHLVGLVGSDVTVTLEIEANIPSGAPENVVRTVTENSRTLRFTSHGFEQE